MTNKVKPFIVAGMPRGGTTFLYHNLKLHPEIHLPFRKEVNYFGTNFARGEQWYCDLYSEAGEGQVLGDISPPYFLNDDAAQRLKDYNPEVKVILTVRDPVEWALSFYEQFATVDKNIPSFEEFVRGNYSHPIGDEPVRIQFCDDYTLKRINQYRELFGKNLLIYDFDFFAKNRQGALQAIESFLGLEPFFHKGEFDDVRINASDRKNIRFISYLLSRESVIGIINRLFPRNLIIKVRSWFDSIGVRDSGTPDINTSKEANRAIAEQILGGQRQEIAKLFEQAPVILGDGQPFEFGK